MRIPAKTAAGVITGAIAVLGVTQSLAPSQSDLSPTGQQQNAVGQLADQQERERELARARAANAAEALRRDREVPGEYRDAEKLLEGLLRRRIP